jgi:alkanesulfonate monooxygenase SsuD/methylene tetrahydromethanopterin reductase-like flavin-dependent oxidoreductase (luciferase family)
MRFDYYLFNSYVPEADGDATALYAKWIEQVTVADQLGYGCAWLTEHHFRPVGGMLPNPALLLAALARHTSRIHLGTAVILLPFRNPVRVAEDIAMLDILSGGRVEVGVGRGMDNEYHPVFGVEASTAQDRFTESLAMLKAALGQESFTWDGAFYQCPTPISIMPKPVQRPHPPLWVPSSRHPENSRGIGRAGVNLMTLPWQPATFAVTREVIKAYREGMEEAGASAIGLQVMGYMPVYVGETPERARAEAEPAWNRTRQLSDEHRPTSPTADPLTYDMACTSSRAIFGDPAMCRAHVERIRGELGLDRLALRFDFGGLPQDRVLSSMRLFATEVAPTFVD